MDPVRLLEGDETRFEARLLRTARRDEPPADAMNRAAVALGLGASASAVAAGTATAVAKAATGHAAAAHTIGVFGTVSLAKWVGIGVVSGLVVTGGLRYASDPVLRESLARSTATSPVAPKPVARNIQRSQSTATTEAPAAFVPVPAGGDVQVGRAPLVPTLREPALREPALRERALREAEPNAAAASSAAPSESAQVASLSSELPVLERARRALVAHDPNAVLQELDTYAHMAHTNVLVAEAEMLAIEALVQRGDIAKAKARAARALVMQEDGAHVARLREIVSAPDR